MNCGTCKHWDSLSGNVHSHSDGPWGECTNILMQDWGTDKPRRGSTRAQVADASGYFASLSTRHDFGCVEHEEKS